MQWCSGVPQWCCSGRAVWAQGTSSGTYIDAAGINVATTAAPAHAPVYTYARVCMQVYACTYAGVGVYVCRCVRVRMQVCACPGRGVCARVIVCMHVSVCKYKMVSEHATYFRLLQAYTISLTCRQYPTYAPQSTARALHSTPILYTAPLIPSTQHPYTLHRTPFLSPKNVIEKASIGWQSSRQTQMYYYAYLDVLIHIYIYI